MKGKYEDFALASTLHAPKDYHTSEEDESRSSGGGVGSSAAATKKLKTSSSGGGAGDGATIELVRRPRGRPPGSKNKPKPPVVITRDAESAMRPQVLEIPGGVDLVDAVSRFARRRNTGLSVLAGTGTVANVTLRQPSTTPGGGTVTFHGRYDILSLSATFLPPSSSVSTPCNGFTISLAGPQGQIVGGSVHGSLLTAGNVILVAAVFSSPSYHRLPIEDEISGSISCNADAGGGHTPPDSGGGAMSIYSCHLPSDVIWAPTARQPPPPPAPY